MRIIFLCLLLSCNAERKLNKIYLNKPGLVAEKTRIWFPCVDTESDTTIQIVDSLVYIECPETKNGKKEDYSLPEVTKFIKVPVNMPVKYVYIKQKVEDNAKIFVRDQVIEDKNDKLEKTKTQVARKNNFNWILIAICITLLFLNILQWRRK